MNEITEFLKKERNNPFRNIFILADKKRKAFALLVCFLKSKLSFKEFLESLIPVNYRSVYLSLKRQEVLNKNIFNYLYKKGFILENGYLNLLGNPFYFTNLEDVLGSITELIIQDEYDARKIIKEDFVILDIGANIGVFSVFCANLARNGIIYAFEPVSEAYKILEKNISFYKNIKPINKGLGEKREKKEIFIRSWVLGYSTIDLDEIERRKESFNKSEEIELISLDEFVATNSFFKIDFIKIDVEGYEIKVLKGGVNTLKKFKPIVAISLHQRRFAEIIKDFVQRYFLDIYEIISSSKNSNDIFLFPKNEKMAR